MFIGEFNCKIDNKGRVTVPSKFREQLNGTFVISRGLDSCLSVYPLEIWKEKLEKLKHIKETVKDHRVYTRFILSGASELEFDAQGRINIPQSLIAYSKIAKEVVITGNNDKIEIWSKEIWDDYINSSLENIDDIVNDLDI